MIFQSKALNSCRIPYVCMSNCVMYQIFSSSIVPECKGNTPRFGKRTCVYLQKIYSDVSN